MYNISIKYKKGVDKMFNRDIFKKKEDKEKTEKFICQSECDKIRESRRDEREREERPKAVWAGAGYHAGNHTRYVCIFLGGECISGICIF